MSGATTIWRDPSRLALSLSAVLLAGLVLWSASRMGASPATAGMALSAGDYVIITTPGGTEEVCLVLDNRSETLLVYRIENQSALGLVARHSLPELFRFAKPARGAP